MQLERRRRDAREEAPGAEQHLQVLALRVDLPPSPKRVCESRDDVFDRFAFDILLEEYIIS